jgi:hypothetical protein
LYIILGTVSVESGYVPNQLKNMWTLADAVLKNGSEYFVCSKVIEAEFEEIN